MANESEKYGTAQDFRVVAENLPVFVWSAYSTGALDYVNEQVLDYFKRTFQEMIEWGWTAIVHPDDLPDCGKRWSYALETGTPVEICFRLKRHDGVFRWYFSRGNPVKNAEGEVVRWVGACTDVEALVHADIMKVRTAPSHME